jgi:hypothetical protein
MGEHLSKVIGRGERIHLSCRARAHCSSHRGILMQFDCIFLGMTWFWFQTVFSDVWVATVLGCSGIN